MGRHGAILLHVVAMAAIIVGCRFRILQKAILGAADSEYWNCLGIRSILLQIPQASVMAMEVNGDVESFQISQSLSHPVAP
jgi:hypothetical protein